MFRTFHHIANRAESSTPAQTPAPVPTSPGRGLPRSVFKGEVKSPTVETPPQLPAPCSPRLPLRGPSLSVAPRPVQIATPPSVLVPPTERTITFRVDGGNISKVQLVDNHAFTITLI